MEKRLKLVMIGSLPIDIQAVKGGVEAVILNLLAGFRELGELEVTHLSFNKDIKEKVVSNLGSNIKIIFVPFRIKYDLPDYFLNAKNLKKTLSDENPDIVHIQEITPQILRFFNYSKEKIVVTQHGIMKEEIKYAKGLRKLKCLFKLLVERLYFPGFKNLVFISDYNRMLFSGAMKKSVNIYNPVNPLFFKENQTNITENSLMYVGVINRRKNLKLVLEALKILKEKNVIFQLHVVGGFKDKAYEKEIKTCIELYQISSQVLFYGWLKQEEILRVYHNCPYFILPSRQETLPVSIGEAMALGKIAIASDVGAVSEMFENKVSGFLFKNNDKADLVNILERLNNSDRLVIENISANAKKEALKKFSPLVVAKQTTDFYKDILSWNKIN